MEKELLAARLLQALMEEEPRLRGKGLPSSYQEQRRLLRGLMNIRPPRPISQEVLDLQDQLLQAELQEKTITDGDSLPTLPGHPRLCLWQGDITTLRADAIVNAANDRLLGCFIPCHRCIDNAIHSAAGIQLRLACQELMEAQGGRPEPTGKVKITPAFNLPSRYVLHTVGPITDGHPTPLQEEQLADCYRSCLDLAAEHQLHSVAFCCISTGEFRFPRRRAAEIALDTVTVWLQKHNTIERVILNVFTSDDAVVYRELTAADR